MPKLGIFSSSVEQICFLLPGIYKMTPIIHSHKISSFPIPVVGKTHSRIDWDMLLHNTYISLWDCKELLSLWSLLILVCLFFWLRHRACGILVPQGWNPHALEWKHRIFTTWLPGNGHYSFFFFRFSPSFASVRSDQIRSVAQSCLTLCDPMNRSTPGLPVHHQLPEFTQTHVHRVSDAIQPSHPLMSPSPLAPSPSQHQSLFQWVNSSYEVAKVLEFQL